MALQNNSATEQERQIRVLLQAWLVGWAVVWETLVR